MGSAFAAGFFGKVGSALKERADQHRENDQKMKDAQAQIYWDAIRSGNLSPDQLQYAQTQLQKIYGGSKPLKELFQKFGNVIGMIHGKGQAPGADAGGASSGTGMVPPPKLQNEGGSGQPMSEQTPIGGSSTAPPGTAAAKMQKPPSFADIVKAGHPSQQERDEREFAMWKRQQELLKNYKIEEEQAKAKAQQEAKVGTTRPTNIGALSLPNAKMMAQQGKVFLDLDDKPIDLSQFPDEMGLKSFTVRTAQGTEMRYEPFSPNQKVITVGNETYAISPMDVSSLVKGGGTALGEHRVGTTSSSESGLNPTTGATETRRTSTPQTPGARSSVSPPPTSPIAGSAKPTSSSGPALLPKDSTAKRMVSVQGASVQLFGDPTQPNVKGLKDYAYIADKAGSREKVGQAVQLTLQGLEQEEKRAGSLMTLLQNYGGIPQALLQSQVAIQKDVIGRLSPEEQEAYNAIISSLSTVVGLRALTSASAAQFSVRALERDIPIPGWNVFTSGAFNNKMGRLSEEVYRGSLATPMSPVERKTIKDNVEKFNKPRSKSDVSAPPKPGESNIDDEINRAVKAIKPAA